MKTTDDQNEMFIVVDRDDNIVGYKTRAECHKDKSLTHRSISVVLYNDKGEILLQKRSMTKDNWPGYYTVSVSGHVSKNTTVEQAAYREMQEEIGIQTKLVYNSKFYIEEPNESEIVTVFTGESNGPFKTHKDEVEYVKFYTAAEADQLRAKMTSCAVKTLQVLEFIK